MKLSTRKVIGINVSVLVLMLVLTIVGMPEVLRSYLQAAVLVGAVGASYLLLGWAKARGRENKLVAWLIILAAVVYQSVMFVLLGMKLGFVRNIYGLNTRSMMMVFLPTILLLVGEEILRGQLVAKTKNGIGAVITTGIVLWLVEIIIKLPLYNFAEARSWFDLVTVVVMPTLLNNILLTYIAYYYDYRINIVYRLIMGLPSISLPIWPDVNEYLVVLFETLLVFVLLISLISTQKFGGVIQTKLVAMRKNKRPATEATLKCRKILKRVAIGAAAVIMLGYVGLMSGLFKYYFLAIGSGSMEPNLYRGDMVLVEKSDKYDELEVGEILVYRHSNVIMVHRIAEKREDAGKWTFITKGDANSSEDSWAVGQSDIIGIAKGKIAAFGYPTLWLNELFNGGKI